MPHEKRKPTRQEKRERQAAWLEKQEMNAEGAKNDEAEETTPPAAKKASAVAKVQQEEDKASQALPAAVKGIELPPRTVTPTVAVPHVAAAPLAPAAFAMNFAAFEDSDDESDSDAETMSAAALAAPKEPERFGCSWSREEMLRLRVAMEPRKPAKLLVTQ